MEEEHKLNNDSLLPGCYIPVCFYTHSWEIRYLKAFFFCHYEIAYKLAGFNSHYADFEASYICHKLPLA